MAEARELVQLLVDWIVELVKRVCNVVANELAHLVRRNAPPGADDMGGE